MRIIRFVRQAFQTDIEPDRVRRESLTYLIFCQMVALYREGDLP